MLRKKQGSRARLNKRRLQCELLEDRRVLATFTVGDLGDTNDANPGDGVAADAAGNTTLRAAIEEANALAGADDIDFSVAGTVSLSLGALSITSDMTVDGGDAITVDAGAASSVVSITDGTATISNITLTNGEAPQGGGVYNTANATLSGVTVSNSVAMAPNTARGSFGGGVFNSGTMLIADDSLITENGAGTNGGGDGFGAGIANYGASAVLNINDSTVSQNDSTRYGGGIFGARSEITITGSLVTGNTATNSALYASGAGIGMQSILYVANAGYGGVGGWSLTINDSTISDNVLYGDNFPYGSGIYGQGYGDIMVTDSMITGNRVEGSGGARGGAGFFWGTGGAPGMSNVSFVNTTIDGNSSSEDSGGWGFRANPNNPFELNITSSTISNNTAGDGGGGAFIWIPTGDYNNAIVNVTDSTITGNSSAGYGGGLQTINVALTVTNSTVDGNTAELSGGGLTSFGQNLAPAGGPYYLAPTTSVVRSTISNNVSSGSGGGIYSYDANVLLDNSTISGNTAATGGGAIYKRTAGLYVGGPYETLVDLQSSTVTNNAADRGGGINTYYYGTARFHNSIISGNSAVSSGPDLYGYRQPTPYYSLIGDGSLGPAGSLPTGNPDPNGNLIGDAANPVDAMLGALADNGGNTLTHLPMPGSPVIDAGDPAAMGGMDQTGGPRVIDGRIDMGSVETGMSVNGDFTGPAGVPDGVWDCLDVNALTSETAAMTNNPAFDMTGDGMVDDADISAWLMVAGGINLMSGNPYARGDANLDGIVDGLDFIEWNMNKFTSNTDWCGGNFNGDSVIDGLDFIEWNSNKFTQQGPITSSGGPSSTIDLPGEAAGRRERLVKVGRNRSIDKVARNPFVTPKMTSAEGSDTRATVETWADARATRSVATLAVHQVQQLSGSVSHAQRPVEAAVDRVFAGF